MTISHKAVARLSLYRTALYRLKAYGASTIHSCDIADTLGVTAAQVRKDFSTFKFTGKKKVGYRVEQIIDSIDRLLQKGEVHRAVVCGLGQAGSMVFIEQLLVSQGVMVVAVFDDNDGGAADMPVPVQPFENLFRFVAENDIKFGIIAAPGRRAQRMLDLLVLAGIKGVLNLSGADLKGPQQCVVNSVSVTSEFEKLVYFVNNRSNGKVKVAV